MPEPETRATAAAVQLTKTTDEILAEVKPQDQIRRNVSQFSDRRAKA